MSFKEACIFNGNSDFGLSSDVKNFSIFTADGFDTRVNTTGSTVHRFVLIAAVPQPLSLMIVVMAGLIGVSVRRRQS